MQAERRAGQGCRRRCCKTLVNSSGIIPCKDDSINGLITGGMGLKDLKHLIYFEDLLQEANNDLIRQAQNEGMKCIGYMCENVPEPLLNLPGCF